MNTTKISILLSGVTFVFFLAMNVGAFGDESFRRQQSQADEGFGDLDKEFAEPAPVKPAPPKVIIKEKIIVIEKRVPVPVPTPTPIPRERPSESGSSSISKRTASSRGFNFTLRSCRLVDRSIECDFSVVSPKDDKSLYLYGNNHGGGSLLFDNIGNKYLPRLVLFGNNESPNYIHRRLIIGISTPVKLYFDNVSSETSSIALLELLANDGKSTFRLKFRDVPLSG